MKRIVLSKSICDSIKAAREEKHLSASKLSAMVGRNAPWMSRVENFKATYISLAEAKALEEALGIVLYDTMNHDELVKKIIELQAENALLKELLMEKWKVQ